MIGPYRAVRRPGSACEEGAPRASETWGRAIANVSARVELSRYPAAPGELSSALRAYSTVLRAYSTVLRAHSTVLRTHIRAPCRQQPAGSRPTASHASRPHCDCITHMRARAHDLPTRTPGQPLYYIHTRSPAPGVHTYRPAHARRMHTRSRAHAVDLEPAPGPPGVHTHPEPGSRGACMPGLHAYLYYIHTRARP